MHGDGVVERNENDKNDDAIEYYSYCSEISRLSQRSDSSQLLPRGLVQRCFRAWSRLAIKILNTFIIFNYLIIIKNNVR